MGSDATTTIGTKLTEEAGRDAIHVAVMAVRAMRTVRPGQHIGIVEPGWASPAVQNLIGIADPFLSGTIETGEWFWMLLYPRTITTLRHVWEHPDVPSEEQPSTPTPAPSVDPGIDARSASWGWMDAYAAGLGHTSTQVIEYATRYLDEGDNLCGDISLDGTDIPDGFWDHYQNVTGRQVANEDRPSWFSCSC